MKLSSLILFLFLINSCNSNSISGAYVCDKSKKKVDTTTHLGDMDVVTFDATCVIEEYNFVGNSTVSMKIQGHVTGSTYVIDKDYIRIDSDQGKILLKIVDDNTLVAEGMLGGRYLKNK